MASKRILIVGSNETPSILERHLRERFETKTAEPDALTAPSIVWSEFILVLEREHRRLIAERFPDEYLLRRVISLNIPVARAEDEQAVESMILEQLENHGFLTREQR